MTTGTWVALTQSPKSNQAYGRVQVHVQEQGDIEPALIAQGRTLDEAKARAVLAAAAPELLAALQWAADQLEALGVASVAVDKAISKAVTI